jgi:mannosyltransferase OCH1-like enzyme
MIQKTIHYCWFGKNPMPDSDASYVAGWKRLLPDYKFMLWNESKFDVNSTVFTRQVAETKKFGFIVDYIRAWAVYNHGGIYLDTDVELLKPPDDLLNNNCFGGFENDQFSGFRKNIFINPGLIFAGEKGSVLAKELMDFYSKYRFIKEDGSYNLTPSGVILTDILLKYGLKPNGYYQILNGGIFTVFPVDYFCPMDYYTGKLTITNNTYSIHHYNASWHSKNQKKYRHIRKIILKTFGGKAGLLIIYPIHLIFCLKETGIISAARKIFKKISKWT